MENKLKNIVIPEYLIPYANDNLIRVGDGSDGSYLVCKKSIQLTDLLISLGVGITFDFEKSFLTEKRVPLIAYDGSTGFLSHLKKIKFRVKQIIKLRDKNYAYESVIHFLMPFKFYTFYKNFRRKPIGENYRRFIKKYIGNKENQVSIKDIVNTYVYENNYKKIFLQIDIEGGEYNLLDDLLDNQEFISGLVIEFHDVSVNLKKIEKFIKTFKLTLVHTHINNIGGIAPNKIPNVLELTFSKIDKTKKVAKLPHKLDVDNSDEYFKYELIF